MAGQQLLLMPFDALARADARRAERRVAWIKRGTACRDGAALAQVTLRDLSQTGCCVESNIAYAIGDRIALRFQNLPATEAEVIWIRHGFLGCRFAVPIAPKQVRALTLASF